MVDLLYAPEKSKMLSTYIPWRNKSSIYKHTFRQTAHCISIIIIARIQKKSRVNLSAIKTETQISKYTFTRKSRKQQNFTNSIKRIIEYHRADVLFNRTKQHLNNVMRPHRRRCRLCQTKM